MAKSMFDIIKRQNGEAFAKAIRAYDNGIFDIPNLDKIVRYAGREAEPIMNFLVSLKNIQIKEQKEHQDPIDLLSQAGYNAYYADTLQKQNAIRKYFARGEELCTFGDAKRFQRYHIINAVKKNVDEIRREDFTIPKREDEYGTSVISIQVLKTGGFISIKNRYNHNVENPDNTFSSNPDNIIEGLSDAIRYRYDVDFSSQQSHLPDGFGIIKGQVYKYNFEFMNIYFCPECYVEKGEIHPINKDYEIMMDNMILNVKEKRFYTPLLNKQTCHLLTEQIKDKKLTVETYKDTDNLLHHVVCADGVEMFDEAGGQLRGVILPDVEQIGNAFLSHSEQLSYFSAPKLKKIGDDFLKRAHFLTEISLPNVETVGDGFLVENWKLQEVNMPKLNFAGDEFLMKNRDLKKLSLPKLTYAGPYFLSDNCSLEELNLPVLDSAEEYFLADNQNLTHLSFPQLMEAGDFFVSSNAQIQSVYMPNLRRAGGSFLMSNRLIRNISLPNLRFLGNDAMLSNDNFVADFPKLRETGCADRTIRDLLIKRARHNPQNLSSPLHVQRQKE